MRKLIVFLIGALTGAAAVLLAQGSLSWEQIREGAGEAIDGAGRGARDLRLVTSVRAALALQKDFSLFGGISVEADDGVVTLTGTVGDEDQQRLAEIIARGVEGVQEVVNELEIGDPDEPQADADADFADIDRRPALTEG